MSGEKLISLTRLFQGLFKSQSYQGLDLHGDFR